MMVPPPLGPGDVDMALPPETRRKIKKLHGFSAQHDVMIHYTITEKCPFRCRGCINALTAAAPHAVDPAAGHRDPARDGRGIVRLIRDSGKRTVPSVAVCLGQAGQVYRRHPLSRSGGPLPPGFIAAAVLARRCS